MARRPRVIAHRGASAEIAEHTLAAYRLAIEQGADGLECDVRLTRDGVPVCVHDRTLARTSSGRGSVSAMRLSDLEQLDFASWRADQSAEPDTDPERTAVVTLEGLLDLVEAASRPLELAIETKHPTRYADLVETTLVRLLRHRGLIGGRHDVRVMSFAPTSLRRVRAQEPDLPTVLLMRRVPLRLRDGFLPAYADAAGPSIRALRGFPEYVELAHANRREVHAWTVDDDDDLEWVRALGVDVVITNRPAAAGALLSH